MRQRYYLIYLLLLLVTLACGFGEVVSEKPVILTRLPTLTPTGSAGGALAPIQSEAEAGLGEVAPPAVDQAAVPPEGEAPPPEAAPAAVPEGVNPVAIAPPPPSSTTATSETPGWSFTRAQLYPDPNNNTLVLYTEMVNETGTAQQVIFASGNFFDGQGQVIADASTIDAYWPVEIVPAGGRMPLELTVNGFQEAASYTLNVQAQPTDLTPRQDFEFLEVTASNNGEVYCVTGQLRNLGEPLQEYLILLISLYNSQGNMISFSHQFEPNFAAVQGDQTLPLEICIGASNLSEVVDHGLQAWGR
jgi:hypothetical protein